MFHHVLHKPLEGNGGFPAKLVFRFCCITEKKSVTDELAGLATMFKEGLLTKSEFDSAKAKLLNNGASFSAHV